MDTLLILGLATLAVVSAGVYVLLGARRRRERLGAWLKAAHEVGLTGVEAHGHPRLEDVSAQDGDLTLRIQSYSDGPLGGGTRVSVYGLRHHVGALTIHAEGLASSVEKSFYGAREVTVGDPAFDADCFVEGPPVLALATLTEEVRGALSMLLRHGRLRTAVADSILARGSLFNGLLQVDIPDGAGAPGSVLSQALPAVLRLARGLQPPADLADRIATNLESEGQPAVRLRLLGTLQAEFSGHARTREAVLAACGNSSRPVRLRALGPNPQVETIEEELRGALDEDSPEEVRDCLAALRSFRPEAAPLLLRTLEIADEHMVLDAIQGLRACGGVDSVPHLLQVARRGETAGVRQAARDAIRAIQGRLLDGERGQLSLSPEVNGALSIVDSEAAGRVSLAEEPRPVPVPLRSCEGRPAEGTRRD
jgi:hypothetical protein